jgi:hypothetical protein
MSEKLAQAVKKSAASDSNLRVGIIQSVDSATRVTVNVGGGVISDMPFLASYSPAAGDNVTIARFDATWLVLGIVGAATLTVVNGVVTSSPTAVTTTATTESDLPFLASQEPVRVQAGHIYEMFARTVSTQSVATDLFRWRVRRDVAVTGQELGFQSFSNGVTNSNWAIQMVTIFEATVDDTFNIFWSLVRIGGTGTITATPVSGTTRSYMKVTDLGLNTGVSGSPWSVTTI